MSISGGQVQWCEAIYTYGINISTCIYQNLGNHLVTDPAIVLVTLPAITTANMKWRKSYFILHVCIGTIGNKLLDTLGRIVSSLIYSHLIAYPMNSCLFFFV